jgi:hypothetical protein
MDTWIFYMNPNILASSFESQRKNGSKGIKDTLREGILELKYVAENSGIELEAVKNTL